ncbi:MAG TPA: hypothetical protein P5514_07330 [Bacteroidales bacterium]|nr:hypothetical protein [Bacteroidales bacterium]HRX96740.1 hypothetical protein [Bacteroidales bacterium]
MKIKHLFLLSTVVLLLIGSTVSAQVFRIGIYNQEGITMGDITKKEIKSSSAGYVDYNSNSGLEINYFLESNLGFGLRWSYDYLGRDVDTYEADLKKMLGVTDDQYDLTQNFAYWAVGTDLGISYQLDISQKVQLEPYFYFGFKALRSPLTSMVYSVNNTTYEFKTKPYLFFGYSYSPGVKLHWNFMKHFGLYASLEYDGNSFIKDDERTLLYSYNSLEISDMERSYKYNSVNFGFGLAFRFGKELNK